MQQTGLRFENQRSGQAVIAVAALAVLVTAAIVVWEMLRSPFWLDEVISIRDMMLPFTEMLASRAAGGHQPLYFSFLWALFHIVGPNELVLRLPNILAAIGALIFVWEILGPSWGRVTTTICITLIALNGEFLESVGVVRPYTMIALLGMGGAWAVVSYERTGQRVWLYTVGVLALATLMTHYSAGLAIAGLAGYALARRKPLWPVGLAILLAALAWVPILLVSIHGVPVERKLGWLPDTLPWYAGGIELLYLSFPTDDLHAGRWPVFWAGCAWLVVALLVSAAWEIGGVGRLMVWLWAPACVVAHVVLWCTGTDMFMGRYFVIPVIAQSAMLGLVIGRFFDRLPSVTAPVAAFALFAVMGLVMLNKSMVWERVERTRTLAWEVSEQIDESDAVIVSARGDRDVFEWYTGMPNRRAWGWSEVPEDFRSAPGGRKIWVIQRPPKYLLPEEEIAQWCLDELDLPEDQRYQLDRATLVEGLWALRFVPAGEIRPE